MILGLLLALKPWVLKRPSSASINTHDSRNTTMIEELLKKVAHLHHAGAYHRRRGFSLADSTPLLCTNHLLEETVEFQGEACITGDREAMIAEAGDVLAIFCHALVLLNISLEEVVAASDAGLDRNFTLNQDEVLTSTPGLTRRTRHNG